MTGGLMQLVAYGAQDMYLTGNPQITFFKVVYKRHTNFAIESIEQAYNGNIAFGQRFQCTIARNGDLITNIFFEILLKYSLSYITQPQNLYYGFKLIDYVEVEIGGQIIDKHYGEWMALWCELTLSNSDFLQRLVGGRGLNTNKVSVPLQFWFCRNPGLALPLIALQYHEVKLNIQLVSSVNLPPVIVNNNVELQEIIVFNIWCDYMFLDTDERRLFAQVSHEYLIEQLQVLQTTSVESVYNTDMYGIGFTNMNVTLRFNHPVKELLWILITEADSVIQNWDSYITVNTAKLQLNGQDRFKLRDGTYFTDVQRYQYHSTTSNPKLTPHIYSFGLKPEEHQPSGTCNFSRIDNAQLVLQYGANIAYQQVNMNTYGQPAIMGQPLVFRVYAQNYNVLRVMSGMAGVAYSN